MAVPSTDRYDNRRRGQDGHRIVQHFATEGIRPNNKQIRKTLNNKTLCSATKSNKIALLPLMALAFAAMPPASWECLGAELPNSHDKGRSDIVWRAPNGGVLIDELKFGTYERVAVCEDTVSQVSRYLAHGYAEWGTDFIGVLVVTVASRARSAFYQIDDNGEVAAVPLLGTEWAFGWTPGCSR